MYKFEYILTYWWNTISAWINIHKCMVNKSDMWDIVLVCLFHRQNVCINDDDFVTEGSHESQLPPGASGCPKPHPPANSHLRVRGHKSQNFYIASSPVAFYSTNKFPLIPDQQTPIRLWRSWGVCLLYWFWAGWIPAHSLFARWHLGEAQRTVH